MRLLLFSEFRHSPTSARPHSLSEGESTKRTLLGEGEVHLQENLLVVEADKEENDKVNKMIFFS